ncbi:AzlD domain-containing protein [uncultured Gardnerella sp.]|uniref:branched-chain amino acid transporter permease n=1 Tax=uncultured Gardnerella sp. TaxID=293424 RepID=UPI00263887F7|nr:AzlD domain-containing protein [uncultured Gardnerella sp.]
MSMNVFQSIIIIIVAIIGTASTRFAAFWIFPESKKPPKIVRYLGSILPYAMSGLLLVYSLKTTNILSGSHGLPEAISLIVVALLHCWRKNMLLSIASGTITYMFLVQCIFV